MREMNAHSIEPERIGATTAVYITIDTEYEAGFTARHGLDSRRANFRRSIACETPDGTAGVGYQLDVFDANDLKAVFFVDPMPALVWGVEAISDVVGPIVARGHDVQLHLHTEWLALAGTRSPLPGIIGDNLKDFGFDEQCRLIDYARSTLIAAGAPAPIAFRAGNYGANDDTLRALAKLGLAYDTSHCPGIAGSACAIGLGAEDRAPVARRGVIEVPVGCIGDMLHGRRHAQLTALSAAELISGISHARDSGSASFTLVSHSFELLSRDRARINRVVRRRFERFCAGLAALDGVTSATYAARPPVAEAAGGRVALAPAAPLRQARRMAEQAVANLLYGY